ncbi:type VI secretion system amidase effector protein Tae4, partial [Helicobacter sp. MIT 14-3879]|uniref:type VI secretion system amidase effector protein Tae4 n=1 Tax=Helicobacter sp. MIT 14-3879 TaxID=2040649 RepID=UPI000E1ED543
MNIKITATCGDKSVSVECKRPSWESVRKAYEKINKIYKEGKPQGAEAVFKKIGGEPYKEFLNNEQIIKKQNTDGIAIEDIRRYTLNSCALRMSYALNYSYLPTMQYLIKNQKLPNDTGKLKFENKRWFGADENLYYLSIYGIRNFLTLNWGNSDKPHNLRTFKNESEVKEFYDTKFSKFDKNGIVVMKINGWSDAGGHTTLWNGDKKQFEDFEISKNYLNGEYGVVDFQFWEL